MADRIPSVRLPAFLLALLEMTMCRSVHVDKVVEPSCKWCSVNAVLWLGFIHLAFH
jgi:hypothetical protein